MALAWSQLDLHIIKVSTEIWFSYLYHWKKFLDFRFEELEYCWITIGFVFVSNSDNDRIICIDGVEALWYSYSWIRDGCSWMREPSTSTIGQMQWTCYLSHIKCWLIAYIMWIKCEYMWYISFSLDCFNYMLLKLAATEDADEKRERHDVRVDVIELVVVQQMELNLNCSLRTKWNWIHINVHSSHMQRTRRVNVSLSLKIRYAYEFLFNTMNKMRFDCLLLPLPAATATAVVNIIIVVRCVQIETKSCSLNCDAMLAAIHESHWPNMVIDRMLLIECKYCARIPPRLIFYKPHGRVAILLLYLSLSFRMHVCDRPSDECISFFANKIAKDSLI